VNEAEARAAITIENGCGDKIDDPLRPGEKKNVPDWEVRTPKGWCFEQGRHSSICTSKVQAQREAQENPIEPCEPGCDCEEENDT
jgi:hypothetical protein